MPFAFCPDSAPNRIVRYVEPGTLPGAKLLSLYDASKNLLIVDRVRFSRLSADQQETVLRTHDAAIEIDDEGPITPMGNLFPDDGFEDWPAWPIEN